MRKVVKGYYFSQIEEGSLGPRKKVQSQIETFKKNGIELELVESPFQLTGKIRGNFLLRQLVCRLPFSYVYSKHKYEDKYKEADVFYIRFLAGDFQFSKFVKKLKKNNPNAKIVMELADYPTTWYMTTSLLYKVLYFPLILKDIFARRYYTKYIDRIAILKPIDMVYGIPTLGFENGIEVNELNVKKTCGTAKIKMLAVAAMCNFHGYDRLIEGLKNYYLRGGKREIELHLVGGKEAPGSDLLKYKELTKKYGLGEIVFFHGEKIGKDLDDMYNHCNIAVASLGMYRIGYKVANSLKIREYVAKGIPIIAGCPIDVFAGKNFQYVCEFPNNETPIDIEEMVRFFDIIYQEAECKVISEIRGFAEEYCDMSYAMRNVIEYFRE